ncbi:MAG: dTDP-4-dehydrorhamnose reductase [Chloroflexota bacterium]
MKILLTGASGQLGRALRDTLSAHEVVALDHAALDITDTVAVLEVIALARPDVVIHLAAWTDTLGCEREPERTMWVNAEGARNVAEAAREAGAVMLHVSTNEVFDGDKGSAYNEDDAPNAINAYGRSKQAGEVAVRETLDRYYIVRTSWVYGPGGTSFPEKILQAARDKKQFRVVTDEIASPTLTTDLARAIAQLIETNEYGMYHLTNAGECSRKEWAEEVLRHAGVDVAIEATTQAEYGAAVRKPGLSTLANGRAAALGITLRPWQDALAEYIGTEVAQQSRALA